jgi:hypothetical protein
MYLGQPNAVPGLYVLNGRLWHDVGRIVRFTKRVRGVAQVQNANGRMPRTTDYTNLQASPRQTRRLTLQNLSSSATTQLTSPYHTFPEMGSSRTK